MSHATLIETMISALASELRNGDVGFTGLATGEDAARYATAIPLAAMALARATHAPDLSIILAGWCVNPELAHLRRMPELEFGHDLLDLPCESHATGYPNAVGYKRGTVDVGFSSGAQVDAHGNLNSVFVRRGDGSTVRLVGPILQPEHFTKFGREVIMMPRHDRRTFVPEVDFRSGVGRGEIRDGLRETFAVGTGPVLLISPLGIFDFDGPGSTMRAKYLHAGVTPGDVTDASGFEIHGLGAAPCTPRPSADELRLLRSRIDPRGVLTGLRAVSEGGDDAVQAHLAH